MVIQSRQICEIELSPSELGILVKAGDILEQIVDTAIESGIVGFKVAQDHEDYCLDEFSNCMMMLNDLCHPCGRLSGYFGEY